MSAIIEKSPHQREMVLATVQGKKLTALPEDLYIPPNSLKVLLNSFSGPLDFLLYLIKKQNLDILDINVAIITDQYINYVNVMEAMHIELAGDYLVMAAYLAELKSRMLLPKHKEEIEDEDPRADLIRRLQEYQRYKEAADKIDSLPRLNRDFFLASAKLPEFETKRTFSHISMQELSFSLAEVLKRAEHAEAHLIDFNQLSTREKMSAILEKMKGNKFIDFVSLFEASEGKIGVVVTFLAILELLKDSLIDIIQTEEFGPIHLKVIEVH
tara:strand:- start:10714 stop:11523 length:810 start_codon:yes stop_codon:yes gene_type:complete